MSPFWKKAFVFACLAVAPIVYWYATEPDGVVYSDYDSLGMASMREHTESRPDADKVTCRFPDFDPFNSQAMKYFKKFPTTSCPDGMPTITYYNGDVIRVNQTHKQKTLKNMVIRCWYRTVKYQRRVDYVNGPWQGPFDEFINVVEKPEFVEVKCENSNGKQVSRMHHYSVRKEERQSSKPPKHKEFGPNMMNVMLIGVDSLASYLFKRAMPKTRNYLLQKMDAVEMTKYNKVGDNTFPNLLAIAAGVYEQDLTNWTEAQGFDPVPFVWKRYKDLGYRTQYMSDRVDFRNFSRPPTDSFNLPMTRSLMKDKIKFDNNCFEDKMEVKLWLDLILEFARESLFKVGRFFSLAMIKRPTHDFPNQASAVDEHYYNFFKEAHETGLLTNTFLVFFGDHGPRMRVYRQTFFGSIEERAANMVIYLPSWFKEKYPSYYKNLRINAGRLTTNFDIYHTVRNLNLLPGISDKSVKPPLSKTGMHRSISLFSEIPPQRTCDDAALTPHMCLCNWGVSVGVQKKFGAQVVKDINALLQPKSDVCATLELKTVISLVILSGRVGRTAMYRVMFITTPGDAMFEATVQHTVSLYFFTNIETLGLISRINMYRGQSDCVQEDKISRMYCYCKGVLAIDVESKANGTNNLKLI